MKLFWFLALTLPLMAQLSFAVDSGAVPNPLPKSVRVESTAPRKKIWESLTPNQKKFAYYLVQAGREGREILRFQLHRHGNLIAQLLQDSLSKSHLDQTKKMLGEAGVAQYLVYAAKFFDQGGPYASSNRKYILTEVTPKQVESLVERYGHHIAPQTRKEIVALLTDPTYEVMLYPDNPSGEGLELTGNNLYEKGITGKEVQAALGKTLNPTLNCRAVRKAKGLGCEIFTTKTPGLIGHKLSHIVSLLKKARPYADTPEQRAEIDSMVKYFETGNIEDFRQANIAWVKDRSHSPVDFILGWVEVYEDWLARIGSWESYVQIVDPKITKIAQALASHAQYFENEMPYGKFKKTFPAHYAPPAIMVYYFQERSSFRSGGYNLPNFDDIRRDVGAKNVIRLPFPGEDQDPDIQAMWRENFDEFVPHNNVENLLKNREKLWNVIVLLHEIIGHGSGTYDVTKYAKNEDPISALGPLGSALEEERADLTALAFGGDPKLVDVGIYQSPQEAKSMLHLLYDFYTTDFLRRTSGQRTFSEAHQRGHWLFISQLLQRGAIGWEAKDGHSAATPQNQVLVVKDYDKFHDTAVELLGELQRIKATRDEKALSDLFAKDAPLNAIQEPWAQAVIERGKDLKINAGYVEQPWRVTEDGRFESFGDQTLEHCAPYWTFSD